MTDTNDNTKKDDQSPVEGSDQNNDIKPVETDNNAEKQEDGQLNLHIVEDAIVDENSEPIKTEYGLMKPRLIDNEMKESYLDYAMSVIVSRALPDIRDGLKPVHRRVMYSMNELGLSSRGKFRKSATVVGDVLGKYHPHGDQAVYDTLVRMAQPFAMRYRLVDGQGNFGSMDGDNAAAMRYTECRMTALSEEMLADIDKNTVDFSPNFDGSREEPQVLPAKVPQLLLNGALGIAVGMATNIPPHNLGEIIDGTVHLIDNPEATVEDLMKYIPAPDFPTGAEIFNMEDVKLAYTTGKGKVLMRAIANIEERKNGFRIIVSEIPYQVNKAELILKIADLVKNKKIEGISDLRDESDRKDGVRIVIELKNSAYPKKVLNRLYELTSMQTIFHVNMLALVDGIQPKVLTLKNVLEEFVKHRQKVVRRRTQFELDKAKDRAHILEGLKKALDHIDEIISTIKKSETKDIAHKNLIAKFQFSDKQTTAILEMRLSTLAGLERKKIEDELNEKLKLIAELERILGDESEILKIIKNELLELKEKYSDERRTKISGSALGEFKAEDVIPNEQVIVSLTKGNYIKRVPVTTYRAQIRGGKGVAGMTTKEEDAVEHLLTTWTHDDIMFFTDKGKIFTCKVYDLPSASRQAKGQNIVNILQISPDEKVTTLITSDSKEKNNNKYFLMGTEKGVIKKTEIEAYKNVRKTGLIAIKLNDNDKLKWVLTTNGNDDVIIVTRNGQSIHFNENDVRPMGRSAAGVRGIKLKGDDRAISMDNATNKDANVLTVSENGLGKRTKIGIFTMQKRGGIGIRAAKISSRTGKIVTSIVIIGEEGDVVLMSKNGQVIRTPLKSIKKLGRDTQGVTLMRLNSSDKVASMTYLPKEPEEIEDTNQLKIELKTDNKNVENTVVKKTESKKIIEEKKEKSSPKEISPALSEDEIDNSRAVELIDKAKPEEGSMSQDDDVHDNEKKPEEKHYNKITPKKINTEVKEYIPVVRAKNNSIKEPKAFVPYLKSSKINPLNYNNITNTNKNSIEETESKHEEEKKVNEDETPKSDKNYWSGKTWKSK